jgi:hypothetical protein
MKTYYILHTFCILPLVIASSIILFSPKIFLITIGLEGIRSDYTQMLGILWVVSTSSTSHFSVCVVSNRYSKIKQFLLRKRYLRSLTTDEKDVLRKYIDQNTKTLVLNHFTTEDELLGIFDNLAHKGILYQGSKVIMRGFSYNMHDWVWQFLNKNPKLVR